MVREPFAKQTLPLRSPAVFYFLRVGHASLTVVLSAAFRTKDLLRVSLPLLLTSSEGD